MIRRAKFWIAAVLLPPLWGSCALPLFQKENDIDRETLVSADARLSEVRPEPELELTIDPNAPALPADAPLVAANVSSADLLPVQSHQPVEVADAQSVVAPKANAVPDIGDIDDAPEPLVEAGEAPQNIDDLTEKQRRSGYFITVGSGPQVRFIKAAQLNIRTQPNRYSRMLGLLYGGDEVHVTIRGDWAKLDDNRWIRSRWLVKKRPRGFKGGPPDRGPPDGNTSMLGAESLRAVAQQKRPR